jgi:uncharacterized membrane protein YbhN (UPF0104 family)
MRLPSLHSHPGRRAWHRSSTTPATAHKDGVAPAPKQPPPDPPGRSAHQRRLRNGIAFAAVLSVLMGALILAVPGLRTVAHRVAHASPGWIALAVALELASCVGYVVVFALGFPAPPGLWVSFEATGVAPPVAVLVLAYLVGYLANVLPIPGGIGILDSGIVGALVLYHAPAASAAAAVLLYHTIALWIPTLGGAIAFATSWTHRGREAAGRHHPRVRAAAIPDPR